MELQGLSERISPFLFSSLLKKALFFLYAAFLRQRIFSCWTALIHAKAVANITIIAIPTRRVIFVFPRMKCLSNPYT